MSTFSAAEEFRTSAERTVPGRPENVGEAERWLSGIVGAAMVAGGLKERSLGGLAWAALGGALIYRGATGHCGLYQRLGMSTLGGRNPAVKWAKGAHRGVLVTGEITVDRPIGEVYAFWRDFANFPRFMAHVESVHETGPNHSHWVARGPMGTPIEWDAEVFAERPNALIAWRSVEGSRVDCAGSVRFRPSAGGRGTDVHVSINYEPPGGQAVAAVARLLGEDPHTQITEDLARFKTVVEAGATTDPGGLGM